MKGIMSLPTNEHGLTAHQETFAQGVASGLSYVAAYRIAYPDQVPTSLPGTLWDNAHDLAHHPVVSPRINALQAQATSDAQWTLPAILDEARKNLTGAQEDRAWAPANGALAFIGRATGLVTDRVEHTGAVDVTHRLSADQLDAICSRLEALGVQPGRIVEALPGGTPLPDADAGFIDGADQETTPSL